MTENRAYNFNPGPAALPLEVLKEAAEELVDYQGTGMSVMELSHRSATYEAIHQEVIDLLKDLLAIPENYHVLLLQGGASLQFSMVPFNFISEGGKANYLLTGSWSEKAYHEATLIGEAIAGVSTKEEAYRRVPALDELGQLEGDAYIHLTSNNTIFGTQWPVFPDTGDVPLIADMSSDILSRPLDINQFGLIYAGAQKNLGPSGVTVVIIRSDLVEREAKEIPTLLKYSTHIKSNSLYHTPPTYAIYMLGRVLNWVKKQGGVSALEEQNQTKAKLIYDVIDQSEGFYRGHADVESRSLMNITFRLASEELEKRFLEEARQEGFVGLNGHRSVGGCRASLYNAVPLASCEALQQFMIDFRNRYA